MSYPNTRTLYIIYVSIYSAILPKGKPWWDIVRLPEDQVSTPKE